MLSKYFVLVLRHLNLYDDAHDSFPFLTDIFPLPVFFWEITNTFYFDLQNLHYQGLFRVLII